MQLDKYKLPLIKLNSSKYLVHNVTFARGTTEGLPAKSNARPSLHVQTLLNTNSVFPCDNVSTS